MSRRVTFDTNVLDKVCRPERFPSDPEQRLMQRIHRALANGQIEGFFSVTMLTIEGIMRRDRASVFAGTRIVAQPARTEIVEAADLPAPIRQTADRAKVERIVQEYRVEQPDRGPLHSEVIARLNAARGLGLKALKAVPRIGAFRITDPCGTFYLDSGQGKALGAWIDKAHEVAEAIESRGVGVAQVKALGDQMGPSDPECVWFLALDQATDVHQERAVERAFAEWADGDSVAAHVAYGLDIFCTNDIGQSSAAGSVLDPEHRAWLADEYGLCFMTLGELAATLPHP